MDGLSKILRLGLRPRQSRFEQFARLLLHGSPVAGGTNTQSPFRVFGEFSNGNASHAINDSIAIIDCTSKPFLKESGMRT